MAKREISTGREKLPTDKLIINAIYQDDEGMFYVSTKPEPVPDQKGWFYYEVTRVE